MISVLKKMSIYIALIYIYSKNTFHYIHNKKLRRWEAKGKKQPSGKN